MPQKQSKSSKLGRNKQKCEKYRATGRREKNKKRAAETHARRMAKAAEAALTRPPKVRRPAAKTVMAGIHASIKLEDDRVV